MRKTNKIYYQTSNLNPIVAIITKIHEDGIELDQTISYPEGGGQVGDEGDISLKRDQNIGIKFIDTQLRSPSSLSFEDTTYKVDGIVVHIVHDIDLLSAFKEGDEVVVSINKNKRLNTTKMHSAMHLMYMKIMRYRENIHTVGCHIKEDAGRFDFFTEDSFTVDEINMLEDFVNNKINEEIDINIIEDPLHPDIRYWICDDEKIPCGGTHVDNTKEIPLVYVSRKNLGKSKERLILKWK